jgi:hypothetical protein
VEVEAIGRVRHKNLVRLLGYCANGNQRYCPVCAHHLACYAVKINMFDDINIVLTFLIRMLVYEYVDNGTLEQWLHGDVGHVSPLTWDHRMKIMLGTAKGCVLSSLLVAEFYPLFFGIRLNFIFIILN